MMNSSSGIENLNYVEANKDISKILLQEKYKNVLVSGQLEINNISFTACILYSTEINKVDARALHRVLEKKLTCNLLFCWYRIDNMNDSYIAKNFAKELNGINAGFFYKDIQNKLGLSEFNLDVLKRIH